MSGARLTVRSLTAVPVKVPMRHALGTSAATVRTPVQIGENFSQVYDMQTALDTQACDYVMPDVERIGGVTGWQRASALAYARGVPMSSHLYPEVSVHLLAATPTAHCSSTSTGSIRSFRAAAYRRRHGVSSRAARNGNLLG